MSATTKRFDDVRLLSLLALACFAVAAWVCLRYAAQPPLDKFAFRQTQTALTAYWLQRNGFSLAYETPIAGPPWTLPFEFPIYQWIVATLAGTTDADLNAVGRLVSFAFLVACVVPVHRICRRLALSAFVFPIFCMLLFSSPIYAYWGRTFMIETTALFFSVLALRYGVDLSLDSRARRAAAAFVVFASAALLQKSTTALPVLAIAAAVHLGVRMRQRRHARRPVRSGDLLRTAACFGLPLLVGLAWTMYADRVKAPLPLGEQMTSGAFGAWGSGTLQQRLSPSLYADVVWDRIFVANLAGYVGIASIGVALALRPFTRATAIVVVSLALGLAPVLLFANLHLIHEYYTAGNLLFVLFAAAVAIGDVIERRIRRKIVVVGIAIAITISNGLAFFARDFPYVTETYAPGRVRDLAIARVIRTEVAPGRAFVAFGQDWSSSLAYFSGRKSFTAPAFLAHYAAAVADPTRLIPRAELGAVVACPRNASQFRQFLAWPRAADGWKIGAIDGCYVAVPSRRPSPPLAAPVASRCEVGAVRTTAFADDPRLVEVRMESPNHAPDALYYVATLDAAGLPSAWFEMLDVTAGGDEATPRVLSRLVPIATETARIATRIVRVSDESVDGCRPAPDPSP